MWARSACALPGANEASPHGPTSSCPGTTDPAADTQTHNCQRGKLSSTLYMNTCTQVIEIHV